MKCSDPICSHWRTKVNSCRLNNLSELKFQNGMSQQHATHSKIKKTGLLVVPVDKDQSSSRQWWTNSQSWVKWNGEGKPNEGGGGEKSSNHRSFHKTVIPPCTTSHKRRKRFGIDSERGFSLRLRQSFGVLHVLTGQIPGALEWMTSEFPLKVSCVVQLVLREWRTDSPRWWRQRRSHLKQRKDGSQLQQLWTMETKSKNVFRLCCSCSEAVQASCEMLERVCNALSNFRSLLEKNWEQFWSLFSHKVILSQSDQRDPLFASCFMHQDITEMSRWQADFIKAPTNGFAPGESSQLEAKIDNMLLHKDKFMAAILLP